MIDIFWFVIKMVAYGFIVGLIIGVGAFCYALISTRFEEGTLKQDREMVASPFYQGIGKGSSHQ
jgi:hypothetical protein